MASKTMIVIERWNFCGSDADLEAFREEVRAEMAKPCPVIILRNGAKLIELELKTPYLAAPLNPLQGYFAAESHANMRSEVK